MRTITFNELRKVKDSLPSGSMHRIADELGFAVDTVRNFFRRTQFQGREKASEYISSPVQMVGLCWMTRPFLIGL